jgi:hypothetical protein
MSIDDIYQKATQDPAERLRLDRMILDGSPAEGAVDYRTVWDEEDIVDFTRSGWTYLESEL